MMQLILLESTPGLGRIGDLVKVRSGYGRNYLLPQGKALVATPKNLAEVEARRAELERAQLEGLERAQARAERLKTLELVIHGKAGVDNRLHGSVGTVEIAAAAAALEEPLEKSELRLPQGRISTLGEHQVEARLDAKVKVMLKVSVQPMEE